MKGVSEVLSAVIIIIIALGLTGAAYSWGLPLIQKNQDKAVVDRIQNSFSRDNTNSLTKKIEYVANNGGEETFRLDVDGLWRLYAYNDESGDEVDTSLIFSDDFNDEQFDDAKWTSSGECVYSLKEEGGFLNLTVNLGTLYVRSVDFYTGNFILEGKIFRDISIIPPRAIIIGNYFGLVNVSVISPRSFSFTGVEEFWLPMEGTNHVFRFYSEGAQFYSSSVDTPANTWYNVKITKYGNNLRIQFYNESVGVNIDRSTTLSREDKYYVVMGTFPTGADCGFLSNHISAEYYDDVEVSKYIRVVNSNSLQFSTVSRVSNVATGVGWVPLSTGFIGEPGTLGKDDASVVFARADVSGAAYNVVHKVWFREIQESSTKGYKINLVQDTRGSSKSTGNTVRISRGDITQQTVSGKTISSTEVKILLV